MTMTLNKKRQAGPKAKAEKAKTTSRRRKKGGRGKSSRQEPTQLIRASGRSRRGSKKRGGGNAMPLIAGLVGLVVLGLLGYPYLNADSGSADSGEKSTETTDSRKENHSTNASDPYSIPDETTPYASHKEAQAGYTEAKELLHKAYEMSGDQRNRAYAKVMHITERILFSNSASQALKDSATKLRADALHHKTL